MFFRFMSLSVAPINVSDPWNLKSAGVISEVRGGNVLRIITDMTSYMNADRYMFKMFNNRVLEAALAWIWASPPDGVSRL